MEREDTAQPEWNLLVLSDLHLNEGLDPETGKTSRLEDFFRDDAFARFLRYHEGIKDQPRFGGRPWLLILNGDVFDFLQVVSLPRNGLPLRTVKGVDQRSDLTANEQRYGLGTTALESEWKLKQIAKGHQRFFAALGWFVARGNQVALVRGNHDVELFWEQVQERFVVETRRADTRRWVREGGDPPASAEAYDQRIRFYPWIYHVPERIYVEHGCQYEAANHFRDFMHPVLVDDPERIELPWGSLFVRYLFNRVEDIHPFADNVKPLTRYLSWAFRKSPLKTMEVLLGRGWIFLRALWMAGQKATKSAMVSEAKKETTSEEKTPLPPDVTERITALADRRVASSWQGWVGSLLQSLISLMAALIVVAFLGLAGVTLFLTRRPWWVAGLYAGAAVLSAFLRRALLQTFSSFLRPDNLADLAYQLEQILAPGQKVPIIALGHYHRPAVERLEDTWYVNTGAWVPIYEREGPVEGREALTFLRDAYGHQGTPELLRWDDAGGAPTRMVLWDDERGH
jgi:UDP-2,3-diacylglucosamine pyrophosphatase LpxH